MVGKVSLGGKLKQREGDLVKLFLAGEFDMIVHGCNAQRVMGSGIAKQIKAQCFWGVQPYFEAEYLHLGDVILGQNQGRIVANAITQVRYGGFGKLVSYDAIDECFTQIATDFSRYLRIGIPMIGAGLGGGNWEIIRTIIDERINNHDVTLVVLPTSQL